MPDKKGSPRQRTALDDFFKPPATVAKTRAISGKGSPFFYDRRPPASWMRCKARFNAILARR